MEPSGQTLKVEASGQCDQGGQPFHSRGEAQLYPAIPQPPPHPLPHTGPEPWSSMLSLIPSSLHRQSSHSFSLCKQKSPLELTQLPPHFTDREVRAQRLPKLTCCAGKGFTIPQPKRSRVEPLTPGLWSLVKRQAPTQANDRSYSKSFASCPK